MDDLKLTEISDTLFFKMKQKDAELRGIANGG